MMTDKQIINSCEFQSRCIQYKDMYSNKHIKCPIVDFAIACRGENKCKYKTVYEQLQRKEQECEELKKIINETKSSSLDLKSFLVGEAIQNEYEQQLEQLKVENEKLKEENFTFEQLIKEYEKYGAIEEIVQQLNQLKAKNEELKAEIKYMEEYIQTVENARNEFEKESKFLKGENKRLKQTLAEIK